MDPDATLKKLRELAFKMLHNYHTVDHQNDDGNGPSISEHDAAELAEHLLALDIWIKSGGFLPDDWNKKKRGRV